MNEFVRIGTRTRYRFDVNSDAAMLAVGYRHEIYTQEGVLFANVMKSVAYVAVGYDAAGNIVLEKWRIRMRSNELDLSY